MTEPTKEDLMKAAVQRSHEMYKLNTSRSAFQAGVLFAIAKPGTPPAVAGEHKPGCPALGGYGHGVEDCCCGATPQPTQAQTAAYIRNKKAIKSTATR